MKATMEQKHEQVKSSMKQQAEDNLALYGFVSRTLEQANIIEETNIIEDDELKVKATGV